MSDTVQTPPGINKKWRVHVKGFEAVILYPALVTPAIVEAGGCLSVMVAVKDDFKNVYNLPPAGQEIKNNILVAQALHAQICLVSWGNASIFDTSDIAVLGHYRHIIAQRHMLYSSHRAAVDKYKAGAYRSWYLGELKKQDFLVEGFDADGKAKKWGIIHQAAAAMHVDAGYKHLIQVNFKEFDQAKVAGMYELAYVYFKLYNDETDLALITKDAVTQPPARPDAGSVEMVEVPKTEMGKAPPHCAYTDPDDDMLTGYFAQAADLNMRPELLRAPAKIGVPKITGDNRRFRLYDDAGKTINIDRPSTQDGQAKAEEYKLAYTSKAKGPFLQSRHPVCIIDPKNWKGKIGVMGDLHISSRQSLFPLANAQVIPGAKPEDSPYIGKIANQSLKSAESLLGDIGKASDLLVLAGDLYDHTRNCDPDYFIDKKTQKAKIKNTGQLWDAMNFRQYEKDYNAYPREIDGLLMLDRIIAFYGQYQKPVIYISGNHEGYERPFGISPRVRLSDDKPLFRANPGIPSDHNLTIYEAALLYGKASYELGTKLSEFKLNFDAKNFQWLYCLYTPWKDFVFSYTAKSQDKKPADYKPAPGLVYNLIALGWGDKEDFIKSAVGGGDTLPRAPMACGDKQVELVTAAVNAGATYNILLSHFTFASYSRDKAFSDEKALVSTKTTLVPQPSPYTPGSYALYFSNALSTDSYNAQNQGQHVKKSNYDIGSFYNNRPAMYALQKDAVLSYENLKTMPMLGKIHYCLSGHAHRAGAYTLTSLGGDDFKVTAMLYNDPGHPDSLDLRALGRDLVNARCLVCGAAGPYSYKNLNGELGGFGMARPQGMILDVPNDRVEWKQTGGKLPRLAVVMDYLWYVGDCPPFERVESPATPEEQNAMMMAIQSTVEYSGGIGSVNMTRLGLCRADDGSLFFILSTAFKAMLEKSGVSPNGTTDGLAHPFAQITLVAVRNDQKVFTLPMRPGGQQEMFTRSKQQYQGFDLGVGAGELAAFKRDIGDPKDIIAHFLSIQFQLPKDSGGDDYDLKSPWCFPVNVGGDYDVIYRSDETQGGEVPDWKYYGRTWKPEYENQNQ